MHTKALAFFICINVFGVSPIASPRVLAGEAEPGGIAPTSSTAATQATHDVGDAERPSARLGVWLGIPLSVSGQPRMIETAVVSEQEKARTVEVRKMSFESCIDTIQKTIDQSDLTKNHVSLIIDTVILRVAKITMDESTTVIACNKHDQRILIERYTPVSQPLTQ
ncbi:MAG: hypothetical protein V3R30_05760 [Kiloniellales bacterium]